VKILVAEDHQRTICYMRKGLVESGFAVDVVDDGAEALFLATSRDYDLLILDVMLPQRDGWSIVTELRKAGKQTPVLFVTACGSVSERVKGLELGADDYMVKPFMFTELRARVQSLLRRRPERLPDTLCIADLKVDLAQRRVTRGGQRIDLSAKEFLLLSLLARRAGEVLPRTVIAEQVWDMNFDSATNVIDVAIKRLRRKVDIPFNVQLIHSVRGMGYVLEER
jgi:two-component system, OmpR family, copper resistance phosphate regulon response regulator CusR